MVRCRRDRAHHNALALEGLPPPVQRYFRADDGDDGLLRSCRADARGRTLCNKVVMTPWEGRWSNHQVKDGMRVPCTGEVARLMPDGRKPYGRGTITSLAHGFER
jgi:hypothetical protein